MAQSIEKSERGVVTRRTTTSIVARDAVAAPAAAAADDITPLSKTGPANIWGDTLADARPLVLDDVLKLIPFRRSWLYSAIKKGKFPAGHIFAGRRVWFEHEIADALKKLLVPA